MDYIIVNSIILSLDIDECDDGNDGGCEDICNNVPGSYYCTCDGGFGLMADLHSCEGKVSNCLSLLIK